MPNPSRETKFSGANGDREMFIFPVQLTTSRIDNLTLAICDDHTNRLIHTLLYVITYSKGMYVYIYNHHIQQSMDQPGKVANPARGQLNRENEYSRVLVRA